MIYSRNGDNIQPYTANGTSVNIIYDKSGSPIDAKGAKDPYIPGRLLLFEDDFNKDTIDSNNWEIEVGNVRGNETFYRANNVYTENGKLVMLSKIETHLSSNYTQSGICGLGRRSWMYGRFEAKMKVPGKLGSFPAFWCLGYGAHEGYTNDDGTRDYIGQTEGYAGPQKGWPLCGEIDITETLPGNTTRPPCNMYDSNGNSMGSTRPAFDIDVSQWHIYAMERTPEYIAMLIDDIEYKRWTFSDYDASIVQAFTTLPMSLLLSHSIGGSSGTPYEDVYTMYVDWVRVYAPVGGIVVLPQSIVLPETFELKKGYRKYFVPVLTPVNSSDQYITWGTSDPSVARVDHGMVMGVDYGTAVITATTCNGISATCTVTVVDELSN